MTQPQHPRSSALSLVALCDWFCVFSYFFVIAVGLLVLVGWTFDISVLKNVVGSFVAMNPGSALGLIFMGLALWQMRAPSEKIQVTRVPTFAGFCLTVVMLIAIIRLAGYWLGWDYGIDSMFFRTKLAGNRMAPNTALMTLVDLSQLEVELEVPETYVADMGLGMRAEVNYGTGNASGKLSALSPEVVKNQVLARVRFDGKQPPGLRQNQRVTARLLIDEKPNALIVQRGPFVESEGGRYAYVVRDGVAIRTPIRLGATSVTAVEILDGLKQGDKIVIAGSETFENAARISINN